MTENNETPEYIYVWEPPAVELPELRLYHTDDGLPICYTCEKLEGNYIVIDTQTYAEARFDVRIVEGKLVRYVGAGHISKLIPDTQGMMCEKEDVSIITNNDGIYWSLKSYELK